VRACYLEGNVKDTATNFPISGVTVQILLTNKTTNTVITGDYKTGVADSGYYTVQFTKGGYYPKTVTNVHLQNGVLTTLNVKMIPIGFSIAENENESFIHQYPNPAKDKINFEIKTGKTFAGTITLVIYDALGKQVYQNTNAFADGGKYSLPASALSNGFFTYQILNEGKTLQRGKFVVE
jgi:hypothetical protein